MGPPSCRPGADSMRRMYSNPAGRNWTTRGLALITAT